MYKLSTIAQIVGGELDGPDYVFFEKPRLSIDTRIIWRGDQSIFWALKGSGRDGKEFVPDAFKKGVRAAVVPKSYRPREQNEGTLIRVEDTLAALQELARYHRQHWHSGPVIGITGSNGKTIVKEWLAWALEQNGYKVCKTPLSYNSQIGVPLSVWLLEERHQIGIFEAGISQPGEMERLRRIIEPKIGIFTNLGRAHSEGFISDEQKLLEKLGLFGGCEVLIFRDEGKFPAAQIRSFCREHRIQSYSWGGSGDWRIERIQKIASGTEVVFENGDFIQIPFQEPAYVENAMHVATTLRCLGLNLEGIKSCLKGLFPLQMRLSVSEGLRNTILINDAYSSDPESFREALGKLAHVGYGMPKTAIITDFDQVKQEVGFWEEILEEVRKPLGLHRIITVGEEWSKRVSGKVGFICLKDVGELRDRLPEFNFHDEVILFKGARRFKLESVLDLLSRQMHRTWLEVSVDALEHNIRAYRRMLPPNVRVMVMLKAAAYGSGEGLGYLCRHLSVDYIAVAYPDEGIILRKQGVALPIMVMHVPPGQFGKVLEHRLEPVIHSKMQWKSFLDEIRGVGDLPVAIHVEVDTGMHRLGFPWHELRETVELFRKESDRIAIKSIFSHLSGADDPSMDAFTRRQIERFKPWVKSFKEAFGKDVWAHIANSAGAARFPETAMDMVRLGIGFYGYGSQAKQLGLRESFRWYTTVITVQTVPPGDPVGYGTDAVSDKPQTVAVLGVGYADGFNRLLGHGRWQVEWNGHKVPTIGRVCMDMTFVDVTGLDVGPGDTMALFHEGWGPEEMAKMCGTITYEMLTGIGARVRRVVVQE
ncbi:MAG: alanine racemase [Flavobacteriales bacterium]|nr:alanine racemase [Flavobacteriales bacterium]